MPGDGLRVPQSFVPIDFKDGLLSDWSFDELRSVCRKSVRQKFMHWVGWICNFEEALGQLSMWWFFTAQLYTADPVEVLAQLRRIAA